MQTTKHLLNSLDIAGSGAGIKSTVVAIQSALAFCGLLLALLAMPAPAQQVTIVGQPVRVTLPVNFSGSSNILCAVTIATNGLTAEDGNGNWVVNPITLSATGLPTTPTGLSFSFTDTNGNPMTQITPVISTSQASITTNILLWVNANDIAEGVYSFSLNTGGGASDTLLLTLQVADIWSASDFLAGTSASFSDPGNWVGGNVPGPLDDVIIRDAGGLSSGSKTTNIVISANTEIASLRQVITVGTNSQDNIELDPGVTLAVTGTNGFSAGLRDRSDASQNWQLALIGADSTLIVSNQSADFDTFGIENQTPLLDMSGLGTFVADLYQMHFDDYLVYPNYDNMEANGYANASGGAALPRRLPVPQVNWARTNFVQLSFPGDPDNWTNAGLHQYSMMIGNDPGRGGSTQRHHFWFGISNVLEMNSVCFAGSGVAMDQTGSAGFNSAFATNNPIAIFRGPAGMNDRMAMFAIADNSGVESSGSSSKAIVDFTGGAVDALVDRLCIALDRTNCNGGYSSGQLYIGAGTFDANSVILGDQADGNNYGNGADYCQGSLVVNSNGLFRANDFIDLGYTTADATNNSDAADSGYGQITVNEGGTVEANIISLGGVTRLSTGNTITVNGGSLVVSNTIADAGDTLTTLTVENGGALGLFINGTNTTPYVFANDLVTAGTATITIEGIANLTLPAQVPLIRYATGTPTFAVNLPSGYSGAIINNGPGSTIDVYITAGAPKSLAWRGYVNNNWDTTTRNWLDLNTGLQTNFANLDDVSFDDTPGVPSTVNLSSPNLIPTSVSMTNSAVSYTVSGSGTIAGSATLTKSGTGKLDIESLTTLTVDLEQGALTGAGTIDSAIIATNAMMNYSGTVSAGVVCGGLGVNSGTINGLLDVQTGGVFTNLNVINGPFTLESDSFLANEGSINEVVPTATVGTNAYLLNNGNISDSDMSGGGTLEVSGILDDTGAGSMTLFRLNILPGALFLPANGGLGTTTINSDAIGAYPGRLSLNAGSTTLITVDPGNATPNTVVLSGALDYGPSQKYQSEDGCTLVITNISNTPFAAGQVFNVFGYVFGGYPIPTGTSTNAFPIIEPSTPGPGLSWDLRQLWPNGSIGIEATPFVTLTNSFTMSGSNVVANLSWSSAQRGYVLEDQMNPANVGLSTNWTRVNGTSADTNLSITNALSTNDMFFRLVYP